MTEPAEPGIVYIFTNEAMPGFVKIGMTQANDVATRLRQLDVTAVPLPFECHYSARVPDCRKLERTLHFVFGEKRARLRREFFKVDPDLAKAIIELVATADVTPSEAKQGFTPAEKEGRHSQTRGQSHLRDDRPEVRYLVNIRQGSECHLHHRLESQSVLRGSGSLPFACGALGGSEDGVQLALGARVGLLDARRKAAVGNRSSDYRR
ncbi:GIY-YIG nuclease family protein [Rhizobium mongolense]|uniref:GIY-YIG nuclease family protein n=1 Tax=Rhizobium mongolense TaxID=57676 RepID=UPI003556BB45